MKNLKKYQKVCFILFLAGILLCSCKGKKGEQEVRHSTGEMVPVSSFSELSYEKAEKRAEKTEETVTTESGKQFLYSFAYDTTARRQKLIYTNIDAETGTVGAEKIFFPENSIAVQRLWSGKGNCLIYADNNALWKLDTESGEAGIFLRLNSEYVNIDGEQIEEVSILENGEIEIYLYDNVAAKREKATISWQDKGFLPEKEEVTVGITMDSSAKMLEKYAKRFNRQNDRYQVKLVEYFSFTDRYDNYFDELTRDILKGNAPDILDVRAIPVELLADKDFFEDLEPRFRKSDVVKKRDLLEAVWRAGEYDGKVRFVMPWFMLEASAVKKESLQGREWTLETFQQLLEENQNVDMLGYLTDNQKWTLLQFALAANCDSFYQVETGNCNFTDGRFAALLECINSVAEKDSLKIRSSQQNIEDFRENKLLVYSGYFRNMENFLEANSAFGDEAKWVGYPSEKGEYQLFQSFLLLGITETASNKEGAWEFLEYLLSDEVQSWEPSAESCFPVRKSAFEKYISTVGRQEDGTVIYADEEQRLAMWELVAHAYMQPYRLYDPLYDIILEEADIFFKGAKTAEETARMVQNRVQLYLEEQL